MRASMTHSGLFSVFEKINKKFLDKQEKKLLEKYQPLIDSLEDHYKKKLKDSEEKELNVLESIQKREKEIKKIEDDVKDFEKRISDRKEELARDNEELKNKIRIIEAKSRPDAIWVQAFSMGYSKAWDSMFPIMADGIDKIRAKLKDEAIDNALNNMEPVVTNRIEQMKNITIKTTHHIMTKKAEIADLLKDETNPEERKKLTNYLNALEWALDGNGIQKD